MAANDLISSGALSSHSAPPPCTVIPVRDVGRTAKRNVDVSKAVGDYLLSFIDGKRGLLFKTKKGTPLRAGNLRRRWLDKRLDNYGFHSFRRFRITHLEAVRAHGHLTKVWAGHSLGNDITSEYAKSLKENLSLRLEEAERVGTGLQYLLQSAPRFLAHRRLRTQHK